MRLSRYKCLSPTLTMELNPWGPHGGRKELTPASYYLHVYMHAQNTPGNKLELLKLPSYGLQTF